MSELKPRIKENGIDYILVGDYYIPDLKLPEEHRPIGKYGRMHREYLREVCPARLHTLTLTGELWTYLADLNEQAQKRLDTIMEQMKAAEGVTEELKRTRQMDAPAGNRPTVQSATAAKARSAKMSVPRSPTDDSQTAQPRKSNSNTGFPPPGRMVSNEKER